MLVCALWCGGTAGKSAAGPVYDPFLERFQVGQYGDPAEIPIAAGYPQGLLEPIAVDPAWAAGLQDLVGERLPLRFTDSLTRHLLWYTHPGDQGDRWLARRGEDLARLQAGSEPVGNGFLQAEAASRYVFSLLKAGELGAAATLAEQLADPNSPWRLPPRARFVWQLRAVLLQEMAAGDRSPDRLWTQLLDLGPFDARAGWGLWTAYRRDRELPLFPARERDAALADFLLGLREGWFGARDLAKSGFPRDERAAVGAALLRGTARREHLASYSDPPAAIDLQGVWVRGMRLSRRGEAGWYEQLAARNDILPGWRMDVWRRASELHFLGGRQAQGTAALEQALAIAAQNGGTLPLRRRVRHWVEQALVLALARGDTVLARRIHQAGEDSFSGEEGRVYGLETRQWLPVLGLKKQPVPSEPWNVLRRGMAEGVVAGGSEPLQAADPAQQEALVQAAECLPWREWVKWGRALSEVTGLSARRQERAVAYGRALAALSDSACDKDRLEQVLSVVAGRLVDPEVVDDLLAMCVDRDIGRASGWLTTPAESRVPALVERLRSSQLDLHALLGFALAIGDMRGILGVASVLPPKGLSESEYLRFLYPLPARGPIRSAILAADSEPSLLLAVARNESLFEPAVRSRAGALGWMQIMPFHYPAKGALPGIDNWRLPGNSIRQGDRILVQNRRRYDGDPYLAVAAYNAGPEAAERWLEQLGGVDDRSIYLAWIGYAETRRYVEKVLIDRQIYDWILNGVPRDQ